jgi:hypothetical protein
VDAPGAGCVVEAHGYRREIRRRSRGGVGAPGAHWVAGISCRARFWAVCSSAIFWMWVGSTQGLARPAVVGCGANGVTATFAAGGASTEAMPGQEQAFTLRLGGGSDPLERGIPVEFQTEQGERIDRLGRLPLHTGSSGEISAQ